MGVAVLGLNYDFLHSYFLVKSIKYKYFLFIYHLVKINPEKKEVVEKSARIHLEIVYLSSFQFVCADSYEGVCYTWGCPYAAIPISGSAAAVL